MKICRIYSEDLTYIYMRTERERERDLMLRFFWYIKYIIPCRVCKIWLWAPDTVNGRGKLRSVCNKCNKGSRKSNRFVSLSYNKILFLIFSAGHERLLNQINQIILLSINGRRLVSNHIYIHTSLVQIIKDIFASLLHFFHQDSLDDFCIMHECVMFSI